MPLTVLQMGLLARGGSACETGCILLLFESWGSKELSFGFLCVGGSGTCSFTQKSSATPLGKKSTACC